MTVSRRRRIVTVNNQASVIVEIPGISCKDAHHAPLSNGFSITMPKINGFHGIVIYIDSWTHYH